MMMMMMMMKLVQRRRKMLMALSGATAARGGGGACRLLKRSQGQNIIVNNIVTSTADSPVPRPVVLPLLPAVVCADSQVRWLSGFAHIQQRHPMSTNVPSGQARMQHCSTSTSVSSGVFQTGSRYSPASGCSNLVQTPHWFLTTKRKKYAVGPLSWNHCLRISGLHTSSLCSCTDDTAQAPSKTIFSGIQPTGTLHLGNYFGAVKKWVELQDSGENVIFCVVDLHSITLPQDPKTLHSQIIKMAASLIACGIDPSRAILFQQSRVAEHAQFNWVLGCLTTMARLGQLSHFKEKSRTLKEIPLGLYVYPVLQSADILLYRATHVPVGEDQRQHVQLATHLARVFNNSFGQTFILPHSMVYDDATARVRSLRQPDKKMSKSEADPKSRIELTDSPDAIRAKFKKAVTDFTSAVYYDPENRPGVSNLMVIHKAVTGQSFEDIRNTCDGLTTAQYKFVVADAVIEHLTPIRTKFEELLNDRTHLNQLLDQGADRARAIASETWEEVKRKVGVSESF